MTKPKERRLTEERLRRIARAGEVFIDGDAFAEVVVDPKLVRGDDYRVDHEKYIKVKQALFKLKRLEPGDVGVMTWRKFEDAAAITVIVDSDPARPANLAKYPMTPAIAAAFGGETAVQEMPFKGVRGLSVCAPIRNSLDDVVGVLEVFASLDPAKAQANVINY